MTLTDLENNFLDKHCKKKQQYYSYIKKDVLQKLVDFKFSKTNNDVKLTSYGLTRYPNNKYIKWINVIFQQNSGRTSSGIPLINYLAAVDPDFNAINTESVYKYFSGNPGASELVKDFWFMLEMNPNISDDLRLWIKMQ